VKSLLLPLAVVALMISTASASENPPAEAQRMFTTLLTAVAKGDYPAFQKEGTPAFQAGITAQVFETVSAQLAPLLSTGYETTFLTELKQKGLQVFLWKVTPKSGGDQFVAKLVIEGDRAAGFWIN